MSKTRPCLMQPLSMGIFDSTLPGNLRGCEHGYINRQIEYYANSSEVEGTFNDNWRHRRGAIPNTTDMAMHSEKRFHSVG